MLLGPPRNTAHRHPLGNVLLYVVLARDCIFGPAAQTTREMPSSWAGKGSLHSRRHVAN